jgi:hypothetical protein
LRISDEVFYLPTKKDNAAKKRKKSGNKISNNQEDEETLFDEDLAEIKPKTPALSKPFGYDPYADNIMIDEQENVDLLETIDGMEFEPTQFKQDFPHLAEELQGSRAAYSMDAVRWDEEANIQEEILPPEEPDIKSLLRRSKTEAEALEIIKYFEKRGEISPQEASKYISILNSKGLPAFRRKR